MMTQRSLAAATLTLGLLATGCVEDPPSSTPAPPPDLQILAPDCSAGPIKPTTHDLLGAIGESSTPWDATFVIEGTQYFEVDGSPPVNGQVSGSVTLDQAGTYDIRLDISHEGESHSSDVMTCTVENQAPTLTYLAPENGSATHEEALITFEVQVADEDDEFEDLTVVFTSSADGELGAATPDASGRAQFQVSGLSVYNHIITAAVSDPWGGTASDTLLIEISECLDRDEDGYSACILDCADNDPAINPGAEEVCDGLDNNCNGAIDELGDQDGDGVSQCNGDCDDQNIQVYPGALEACDGVDNDCDNAIDEEFDVDGDGFATCADCDDDNADTYPGAPEICDGLDNDCDEIVDNDLVVTFCKDGDQDGRGDPNQILSACQTLPPEGYVLDCSDCDDNWVTVYEGAPELCDGLDNDCDASLDEGLDANPYFVDGDQDGFGNGDETVTACAACPECATNGDDCDDARADIFPGADESCDAFDQDCDGAVDEGVETTLYDDVDGDGFGSDESATLGCTAQGGQSNLGGDCDDDAPETYPAADEICDAADNDCDGQSDEGTLNTYYADGDGDGYGLSDNTQDACTQPSGYAEMDGDCHDDIAAAYPGADEICDGVDGDCDGDIDEGVLNTYYSDQDGDGFGQDDAPILACSPQADTSDSGGDCDDGQSKTFPGAPELCDGQDNNCDGVADEGLDASTFYADADGDSYGDLSLTTQACAAPMGYVANGEDCDDGQSAIHPGASESCNLVDDNCNDVVDEGVQNTYFEDQDGDGYGQAGALVKACSLCVDCAENDDDCDDENALTYPDAPERFDGQDNDCDGAIERQMGAMGAHLNYAGDGSDEAGWAVAALGDYNGDGLADMGVGAPGQNGAGATLVFLGSATLNPSDNLQVDRVYTSDSPLSRMGSSLVGADLNNDGFNDLIIASETYPSTFGGAPTGGRVGIIYGESSPESGDLESIESAHFQGTFADSMIGQSLSHGDFNCDGLDDILIGAPGSWVGLSPNPGGGAAYLLPGQTSIYQGQGNMNANNFALFYGDNNDLLGLNLTNAGDMDGDGCLDLAIAGAGAMGFGPQTTTDMGVVYAQSGSSTFNAGQSYDLSSTAKAQWEGMVSGDYIGQGLGSLGDINGDGFDDLMVGRADTQGDFSLGFIFMGDDNWADSGDITDAADIFLLNNLNGDLSSPSSGTGLGDINGDGIDDFAIALPESQGGLVFIFFGKSTGFSGQIDLEADADVILTAAGSQDRLGHSVAGLGDINGDGIDDFMVGAPGADGGAGAAYLFFGYAL